MIKYGPKPKPLVERFWKYVDKTKDCWSWNGTKNGSGYGVIRSKVSGEWKYLKAHRVSYEIAYGKFNKKLLVCHHCDNPQCVNPKHLFLDTCKGNILDAVSKGRMASGDRHGKRTHPEKIAIGSNHGMAKLLEEDVVAIRDFCSKGVSYRQIAENYGITKSNVYHIVKRLTWIHI